MKKKSENYIIRSTDGKWFATGEYYFTDVESEANKFTKNEAKDIISSITVIELEMIAA